ncbi:MAG: hypothetical protein GY928_33950 [Colwellia sp.]|nr:hypothetical protein [Colwellia sp.]
MTKPKFDLIEAYSDGFTSESTGINDLPKNTTSATSGYLCPSRTAEHYLGIKFSVGDIMTYCIRRFGYTAFGNDGDKSLAVWVVTTPMKGVFLDISPSSVSPFGYTITEEIASKIHREELGPMREWGEACAEWAKEKHGITLLTYGWHAYYISDAERNEEWGKFFTAWGEAIYGDLWGQVDTLEQLAQQLDCKAKDVENKAWDAVTEREKTIIEEFKGIYPPDYEHRRKYSHPYYEWGKQEEKLYNLSREYERSGNYDMAAKFSKLRWQERERNKAKLYKTPFWEALPEDSLTRKVNEAIMRTLQDLYRPVGVRDWHLNIMGRPSDSVMNVIYKWDDNDNEIYDYTVERWKHAGHGADLDTIANRDWYQVRQAFCDRFGGVKEGIERLNKYLSGGGGLDD